jgi:hypothetical protein
MPARAEQARGQGIPFSQWMMDNHPDKGERHV